MKEAIAVYPGTRPVHPRPRRGSAWRASILFEKVVVAVARQQQEPGFGLRTGRHARDVSAFPNVEAVGFRDCLLMEFLQRRDARDHPRARWYPTSNMNPDDGDEPQFYPDVETVFRRPEESISFRHESGDRPPGGAT